jgi:hydroxylamine dehydrogenase
VLAEPTPARCQQCHASEVAQFDQSRHSIPAYVAYAGSKDLSADLLSRYQAIPEGTYAPDQSRNALYALEGPDVTQFACEACHNVGQPKPDGSVGECEKCHLRHEFSLEQARKPETCNYCHIGPDHPQWEIYHESPHGIAYATGGQSWHWDAEAGTLTASDFPAPTCAVCHMSGFGATGTTHDVGDRLTWYLFAPVSERRPAWQDNGTRMQGVCRECHNEEFINTFYANADRTVEAVNAWVTQSDEMVAPLQDQGLMTVAPFDEPIDFTYFELWHHWGRTAKFGAWMQGPDYVQWHGGYEILKALADLQDMVDAKLAGAGQ